MKWKVRELISSLRTDATDPDRKLVPDGVVDLSSSILPLVGIASTGRVLNEYEEYAIGRFVGSLWQRLLPNPHPTKNQLQDALLGITAVLVSCLREAVSLRPDLSIDEILSEALSDEKIRNLVDEFKVVPVENLPRSGVRPLFGIMRIFSEPITRTAASMIGPVIRRMGKLEFFIHKELGDFQPGPEDDPEPEDDDALWDEDDETDEQ